MGESPLHLGWCDWSKNSVTKGSLGLIHYSWHIGTASGGQRSFLGSTAYRDETVYCKWEHSYTVVAPHAASQPASLAGFRVEWAILSLICSTTRADPFLFEFVVTINNSQHFILELLGASSSIFLRLSFLICKLGIIILSTSHSSWEPVWPICLTQDKEALDWRMI